MSATTTTSVPMAGEGSPGQALPGRPMLTSLGVAAATPPSPVCSDRGDTERAPRTRRGGFGQRSDITLTPAPLDIDDPACRERPDLAAAWDMKDPGDHRAMPPALAATVAEARRVCSGCPHLIPCGDHALRFGESLGLWGGMSPDQRRRLRRIAGTA